MKTKVLCILLALTLLTLPVIAQDTRPEQFIPADFTGFLRLNVTNNNALDLAAAAVALFQPNRFDVTTFQGFDTLFPVDMLDAEDVTFSQAILPWLKDEVVVAYRQLNSQLQANREDVLVILPPSDTLRAASTLAPIIQFQDLPEQLKYRGSTIYIGDRTAIAFTAEAVFIGPADLIQAALDVRAGEAPALIKQTAYAKIHASSPQEDFAFVYLQGANVVPALSVLLSGDVSSAPLLSALGETLRVLEANGSLEASVLTSSVEGVGVSIVVHPLPQLEGIGLIVRDGTALTVEATATIATASALPVSTASFDPALLNLVPQSAIVVQSGGDIHSAAYELLSLLPLTNYATDLLRAFPLETTSVPATGQVLPNTEELQQAVAGFIGALSNVGDFNLEDDFLAHLAGSYAAALIPRPNNPTPVLNTPFDVLLLAQAQNANAALNGATELMQLLGGVTFETETIGTLTFNTLFQEQTGEVVLRVGVVDNTLVVATGTALEQVLAAQRGDNRLVDRERWQSVSGAYTPQLFVNMGAFYNVFIPVVGGQLSGQTSLLAARGDFITDTLYQLHTIVSLPTG